MTEFDEIPARFNITEDFIAWLDTVPRARFQEAIDKASERDTEFWDEDSFVAVVTDVLKGMYVDDTLANLVLKGMLDPTISPDGTLGYELTDDGIRAARDDLYPR